VLEGIADPASGASDLLVVFDEPTPTTVRVAVLPEKRRVRVQQRHAHRRGLQHFITTKADLRSIEPVIAHEMTHACVQHLPLPLWLNEGLAVNTEQRSCTPGSRCTRRRRCTQAPRFWG
jgi:hypothetical protein